MLGIFRRNLFMQLFTCFRVILLPLVIAFLFSCRNTGKEKGAEPPLFTAMNNTGIEFANNIHSTKDFNIFSYRNFYNGGGVAIGDINNDGLADVFFSANMGSNKLYLNKGNWNFEDITVNARIEETQDWSTGVVLVDINNDSWLDIFVCNAGYINGIPPECKLFINNHDLTFTESAAEYGLTNRGGYTTHAAFFDYDMDGDLDCFIINNSFIPVNTLNYANKRNLRAPDWPVADFLKGGGDHLLRNDNGKFVDVSKEAGIYGSLISFGLGVTIGDVNGDLYPDIYVSNDFFEKDYLYINQKNGTYKDELENRMQHISHSSMGADMADINNDGFPDIFTTDMLPYDDKRIKTTTSFENYDVYRLKESSGFFHQFTQNTLQLNSGAGKFYEIAYFSGVAASDWSWGGLIFDADNDGWNDIFVCNGIYHDVTNLDFMTFFANDVIQRMVLSGKKEEVEDIINKMPSVALSNKAFRNNGNLTFSDVGKAWGLDQPSFSNGSAYGDLDNDGDLDLITNNVNGPAMVYRNNAQESHRHHYMAVSLKQPGENNFAVGSIIKVFSGNTIYTREVIPTRGFQSSVDYKNIIGLGTNSKPDSMWVFWPDRTYSVYYNPPTDTSYSVQKPTDTKKVQFANVAVATWFKPIKSVFDRHTENEYVDFYAERNIPSLLSREGPRADTADVNNDGLVDIFVGGAEGQPGQLYIAQPNGSFTKKNVPDINRFALFEDTGILFFDSDNDGDKDLFVGAGGNNHQQGMPELQHRLYINDGKGNFALDNRRLPVNSMNIGVAAAIDFDKDGDQDIFVGSRSVPFNYGVSPQSYLLENDGKGSFTDVTPSKAQVLQYAGMITGAVWVDMDGDKNNELVICGEWMSPRFFTYDGTRFIERETNLKDRHGWWKTVTFADVNSDGRQDLILGNIGENFYLRPSADEPVKLWLNDFDHNGSMDKIITRTIDGKDMPVFVKGDMQDQFPVIKKQNLKNEAYAEKTIQQLFPDDAIRSAVVKQFNYPASCVAINEGNYRFSVQKLPEMVQLSSVNAICVTDIDGNGVSDLILGGNEFGFLPQFGRLDASFGHVLIGENGGNFTWIPPAQSGVLAGGETRDIISISNKGNKNVIFFRNNDYPLSYELKTPAQ